MIELWQLFISFTRASLAGFGGGPAMITLIQYEVVDLRGWLTAQELLDAYAFANTLPSPIATKLAAFVGFHQAGWAGATAALMGVTVPTAVLTIGIAALFTRYRHNRMLVRFLTGVRPVVIALLMYVVWNFAPSTFGDSIGTWLSNWPLILIAVAATIVIIRYKVHPLVLIIGGAAVGVGLSLIGA